jgi:hypothetical protein
MANDDKAESDVEPDPKRADSRETGGVPDPGAADQASTTGSTPDDEYVGRVAGSDIGYEEETGAERRSDDASATDASGTGATDRR